MKPVVNLEINNLIVFLLLGVKLGLFLDALILIRNFFLKKHKAITGIIYFIFDFSFFFFSFVFSFKYLFNLNMGIARVYFFLAELLGFLVYKKTISIFIYPIFEFLLSALEKIFSPIFLILKKILRILMLPLIFVAKIINKLIKKYKFILKKYNIMLYNYCIGKKFRRTIRKGRNL